MSRINWARVILGGLLAGVIINIVEWLCGGVLLRDQWEAAMKAVNVSPPSNAVAGTIWTLYAFVVGIWAVWLYAAIRSRYGAGAKTAACAGFATWILGYLLWSISLWNMGFLPGGLLVWSTALGLVEILVATIAGAWVYKE